MPTQITLYPGSFTSPKLTHELEAILGGLQLTPGKVSEALMGSIRIDIYKENLRDIEEEPFLLMEGFVDFAKRFHQRFPDFVYFASLDNRFYLELVLALSGNISAVQKEDKGTIYANGHNYLRIIEEELSHFVQFAETRTDCAELSWEARHLDLQEYLHLT